MRIVTLVLAVHAPNDMTSNHVSVLIDQMLDDGCTEMMKAISDNEQECRKLYFSPAKVVGNLENQPRPMEPVCKPTHLSVLDES